MEFYNFLWYISASVLKRKCVRLHSKVQCHLHRLNRKAREHRLNHKASEELAFSVYRFFYQSSKAIGECESHNIKVQMPLIFSTSTCVESWTKNNPQLPEKRTPAACLLTFCRPFIMHTIDSKAAHNIHRCTDALEDYLLIRSNRIPKKKQSLRIIHPMQSTLLCDLKKRITRKKRKTLRASVERSSNRSKTTATTNSHSEEKLVLPYRVECTNRTQSRCMHFVLRACMLYLCVCGDRDAIPMRNRSAYENHVVAHSHTAALLRRLVLYICSPR